ncbi:MAG TPA: hypothetical protein VHM00_15960 [Caldimonas sp.]|jgi:hypothetical protein|nr:hypothetical protein [Caldimonas sp.]HEX2542566.1 hypothetical protein [Caldimonas sp.]
MSARHLALLNRSLLVGSAFAALVLLVLFYTVVSGAVDRAASRRADMSAGGAAPFAAAPLEKARDAGPSSPNLLLAGAPR